ncbi:cytochrome b [Sphingomonas sp. CL5.1]|uniref:cytochrome b n=1 Tax=Sphingomonas sp. CL5.1 TaxID=2653203 RepID=UPI001583F925|nr:cytochrome b [Sphingomonas sp. CL5.1]QKR99600.1 cytochrome b [Sphingomonas sp. CL5.1]
MSDTEDGRIERYPPALRLLHWVRALLVLGLIAAGWTMTRMSDAQVARYGDLYPWHKSFGLLVLMIVLVQLAIRARARLPEPPAALPRHEAMLSRVVHRTMYALLVVVPVMGYSMSSTYTHSDGVPFFGLPVPELLPKNDHWFAVFQWLHRVLAYTLLGLVALHVGGALKHRFLDRDRRADVLPRMW